MPPHLSRTIWAALGLLSLAVGVVGLFLPLLPTAPFVLLSAYCFSQGSPRLHAWLHSHRFFGPMIHDWHRNRVVRRRTKILATISTSAMIAIPVLLIAAIPVWAKAVMIAGGAIALLVIWLQRET